MKKILLILLCSISLGSLCAQEQKRHVLGDMNGDNELDITDVTELVNVITGKSEKKYIYTIEDFIYDNSISGTFMIDGKEKSYANGYECVDLGLPSGVKWATVNMGASAPEQFGNYYAWGEIKAYGEVPSAYPSTWTGKQNEFYLALPQKETYNWLYYKWGTSSDNLYKYVTSATRGPVDDIEVLEPADDVANVLWGRGWRMPTFDEIGELRSNCYWKWTTDYNGTGIQGYIIYKVKSESDKGKFSYNSPTLSSTYTLNDKHIFLPAAGYRTNDTWQYVNTYGSYWSSTLYYSGANEANYVLLSSSSCFRTHFERYYGRSVRAVCK